MNKVVIGVSRGDSIRGKIKVSLDDISENLEGRWSVVQNRQGEELVKINCVSKCSKECQSKRELGELKRILQREDLEQIKEIRAFEEEAEKTCNDLIEKHDLPMKIVKTNLSFDRKRLKYFFVAEERVDFRGLVHDLVTRFHKMIRLQQIGPRDHARILGGAGICGRELCCAAFLEDASKSNLKNLSGNGSEKSGTEKITGLCGKLMCCQSYEK